MAKKDKMKQGRIKPKVIFGFMLVLGIALAALGVTYKGFIELTQTQQTLSDPSRKLIKLNSILTDIYEAESNIRTYTFTQNESYLAIYLSFMRNINHKVDSLLMLTNEDPVQAEKIRFIQDLLHRKRRVLAELVELKRNDQSSRFYSMALEEVEKLELDSLRESSVITSVTTTTTSRRDSVVDKPDEESQQGAFSRLLRWFSKREPTDTTITKLIVEVETQIDTLRKSVMSPSDSLLNEVVNILQKMQEQQEMALYNISEMEMELLNSDKEIMDQIRTVVSLLEREELMNSFRIAEEVREGVQKSTTLLLILGGTAFLLVVFFTSLIFRDISKANFYRNQLLEAKQYAEKLLKIKEEFLANMNHEIRTPLSAIVGLSKQLQHFDYDDKQKFYIESLNSSSQHLMQIVNDILDLSKIEGDYIKFESIPFVPSQIAEEALNTFVLKAQDKGIETHFIFKNEGTTFVLGDPFRLKQILYNLISNALKFTNQGSVTVTVEGEVKSDEKITYKFIVSDTGIGIPPEKVDSIFDQFIQVDSSTTRIYGGTGLGLTIVKKLTELQGGTVSVSSEMSKGATFTVELTYPLTKEELRAKDTFNTENLKLPKELKILVVDDDPIGQLLVSEMLKALGVKPQVLNNARDAIEAIKNDSYSIVLTDIQMPEISGFDLIKKVKDLNLQNFPVMIALTANSTIDNPNLYSKAGFHSALIKPFDEVELFNTIAPIIGLSKVDENSVEKPSINGSKQDYDIADIRRFAGDDDESIKIILQSFIDNSQINLEKLVESVNQRDWNGTGEVVHRMKSAFRQLKVNNIANTLEHLENIDITSLKEKELDKTLEVISKEVSRVQELLQQDIENI